MSDFTDNLRSGRFAVDACWSDLYDAIEDAADEIDKMLAVVDAARGMLSNEKEHCYILEQPDVLALADALRALDAE